MTNEEILKDFPELTLNDIYAALAYASDNANKSFYLQYEIAFDQNISYRLIKLLKMQEIESVHV